MNKMTYEKLQYNEMKDMLKTFCVSELGRGLVEQLEPSQSLRVVKARLNETTEARAILDAEGRVPFLGVSNIENITRKLEKGMILSPSELTHFADFLRGCRKIKRFMSEKEFFAPVLASYANSMTEYRSIEEEIENSIKGNMVDSQASKELKRIRSHIEALEEKISERLNKFLNSSTNKKFIQDQFITKKDGRFTIPIKSSYKNQVQGTIVEISSKGSTVFVEPAVISRLAVELEMLKSEEQMEEYQILATLSGLILENIYGIKINIELISQYDFVFAKGKFSRSMDGIAPMLNDTGYIKIVNGKHPLLPKDAVPLNFEIGEEYRSLIITGPNAGGKTIVLKTVGLVTLATMSGLHIYADKATEISVFEKVFVDIGDNQSIENALSTFSSHMKNISEILKQANNNTLLLFDEIGSGTEPNEGAALAISILEEFYHKGCITVATTHYGEIKRYSEMHSDFMNAAMQFNSETLEPFYKLIIGKSGESNALWISKKMDVSEAVLARAKDYMENKEYCLNRIQESKVRKKKVEVEKPVNTYEYQRGDRVNLLDYQDVGIVYRESDNYNNIQVYYKNEIIDVNDKRLNLDVRATDLYPDDYDLNTLFVDYHTRKMEHDIERGSKKRLREIQKEIRKNKK